MRRIGIVGAEGAKFTPVGEHRARQLIRQLIIYPDDVVVSGGCHLGGIDIWAEEEARALDIRYRVHLPKRLQWNGGYRERNILIAEDSTEVHCIAVDKVPDSFKGRQFLRCYHHKDEVAVPPHVKSGGCWTTQWARGLGKIGLLHVVSNFEVLDA